MPRKISIIQGHPDSSRQHLCHVLADVYADAAAQAGHSVNRVEIAGIEFPLLRTQEEFNSGTPPASLKPAVDAIVEADHIVLIFPLWLGTMPALVKAFLEQVIRPGVAFAYEGTGAKKLLSGRSRAYHRHDGDAGLAIPDILLRSWHSQSAPKYIQVCRLLTCPDHDVRHDREGLRRNEIPMV